MCLLLNLQLSSLVPQKHVPWRVVLQHTTLVPMGAPACCFYSFMLKEYMRSSNRVLTAISTALARINSLFFYWQEPDYESTAVFHYSLLCWPFICSFVNPGSWTILYFLIRRYPFSGTAPEHLDRLSLTLKQEEEDTIQLRI